MSLCKSQSLPCEIMKRKSVKSGFKTGLCLSKVWSMWSGSYKILSSFKSLKRKYFKKELKTKVLTMLIYTQCVPRIKFHFGLTLNCLRFG